MRSIPASPCHVFTVFPSHSNTHTRPKGNRAATDSTPLPLPYQTSKPISQKSLAEHAPVSNESETPLPLMVYQGCVVLTPHAPEGKRRTGQDPFSSLLGSPHHSPFPLFSRLRFKEVCSGKRQPHRIPPLCCLPWAFSTLPIPNPYPTKTTPCRPSYGVSLGECHHIDGRLLGDTWKKDARSQGSQDRAPPTRRGLVGARMRRDQRSVSLWDGVGDRRALRGGRGVGVPCRGSENVAPLRQLDTRG